MIANSKMTVFPDPVGALTTRGAFVYKTCEQRSNAFHVKYHSWMVSQQVQPSPKQYAAL